MAGRRGGEQTVLQRWAIIVDELGKVASASSVHGAESYAVEEAILGYNPRYANGRSAWSFQGTHAPPALHASCCYVILEVASMGQRRPCTPFSLAKTWPPLPAHAVDVCTRTYIYSISHAAWRMPYAG